MTTHADTPETESDGGQASGRAHRAESCMSRRVRQMSYDHLCALLRGVLLDGAHAGPSAADGIGTGLHRRGSDQAGRHRCAVRDRR